MAGKNTGNRKLRLDSRSGGLQRARGEEQGRDDGDQVSGEFGVWGLWFEVLGAVSNSKRVLLKHRRAHKDFT